MVSLPPHKLPVQHPVSLMYKCLVDSPEKELFLADKMPLTPEGFVRSALLASQRVPVIRGNLSTL